MNTSNMFINHISSCDGRWVHALCQGLTNDEDVEYAADEGFDCTLCRTHSRTTYGNTIRGEWTTTDRSWEKEGLSFSLNVE